MKKMVLLCFGIQLILSCAASQTEIQRSWKEPSSTLNLNNVQKVLVVAMTDDEGQRRIIEDAYVSHLNGKGTPSYAYFNQPITQVNQTTAEQKLENDGYNAAILVRLANHSTSGAERKTTMSVDPSIYYGFGGNFSAGIGVSLHPGYNTRKDNYSIDTSVYAFPQGKLVWSGTTLATNPKDLNDMAHTLAHKVFSQIQSDVWSFFEILYSHHTKNALDNV